MLRALHILYNTCFKTNVCTLVRLIIGKRKWLSIRFVQYTRSVVVIPIICVRHPKI